MQHQTNESCDHENDKMLTTYNVFFLSDQKFFKLDFFLLAEAQVFTS